MNSTLMAVLLGASSYELSVVLRRIDADGRFIDDADEDRMAVMKDAELFEGFDLLDWGAGESGEAEEEVAAVGVETDVLVVDGWIGGEELVVPGTGKGDGCTAEVNRPLAVIEDDFDAGRIVELVPVPNWSGECAHDGGRVAFEQFDGEIDCGGRDFRFVALNVYKHIDIWMLACDFGDAVGATGAIGTG